MYESDYFGTIGLPSGEREPELQELSDQLERLASNLDDLKRMAKGIVLHQQPMLLGCYEWLKELNESLDKESLNQNISRFTERYSQEQKRLQQLLDLADKNNEVMDMAKSAINVLLDQRDTELDQMAPMFLQALEEKYGKPSPDQIDSFRPSLALLLTEAGGEEVEEDDEEVDRVIEKMKQLLSE